MQNNAKDAGNADILDEIERRYGVDRSLLQKLTDALSGRTHAVRQKNAEDAFGVDLSENDDPSTPAKRSRSSDSGLEP